MLMDRQEKNAEPSTTTAAVARSLSGLPVNATPRIAASTTTTAASLPGVFVERAAGVVAEHVVQRGAAPERGLEHARGTRGLDRARVHERDPVAVGVGLVHVVGGHQHGDRRGLA